MSCRGTLLGLAIHSRTDSRSSYYLLAIPQHPQVSYGLNGKCCEWSNVPPCWYLWQWKNWVFLCCVWRHEGAEVTQGADLSVVSHRNVDSALVVYIIWGLCHTTCFLFFFLLEIPDNLFSESGFQQKPIPSPHRTWEVLKEKLHIQDIFCLKLNISAWLLTMLMLSTEQILHLFYYLSLHMVFILNLFKLSK